MKNQLRIGVFACDCGGEIAGIININPLLEKTSRLDDVVLTESIPFGCTPDGEETIQERITKNALDRVILLGCSPRIMEKKFQKICFEAGLNPSFFEMINLRDQCTWIYGSEPDIANSKAWDLVRMGIARSRNLSSVEPLRTKIHPQAMVIGSGIAGMISALSLADQGIKVHLVEKGRNLGETALKIKSQLPLNRTRKKIAKDLVERIKTSSQIKVQTQAEPATVSGSYGNYEIKLKMKKGFKKIKYGAVILASGARELKPDGYYSYGKNEKVITQFELENKIAEDPSLSNIKNVVMIQCVGAREKDHPYCGRICCLDALENAIFLKSKKPDISLTILHRDIPVEPGPDKKMIDQAHKLGIDFIRITKEHPPDVTASFVKGQSRKGQLFKLPYDLVILSTPQVPDASSQALALSLKFPVDQYGFFPDTLPNLKPYQFMEPCIYAVGNAHWPCTTDEAIFQAYGRSARLASLIKKQEINLTHVTAMVDSAICRGCGTCIEQCPFGIPLLKDRTGNGSISFIDPFLCNGCGICTVHCPNGAVTIPNFEDETLYYMVEAALSIRDTSEPRAIAFLCEWSGYASADLAGVKRKHFPREIFPIRIPCAGRISTGLILRAFSFGADGVIVCACEEGDCHYLNGNKNCETVIADTMNLIDLLGIERERFNLVTINPTDVDTFCKSLEGFISVIKKLEPSISNSIPNKVKVS